MENQEIEPEEISVEQQLEQMSLTIQKETIRLYKKGNEFLKAMKKGNTVLEIDIQHLEEERAAVKDMTKDYEMLLKLVYPKGRKQSAGNEGKPDMARVTSMKSTVGAIVRDIPTDLTKTGN